MICRLTGRKKTPRRAPLQRSQRNCHYVVLCVTSAAGLQRVNLGAFERYGEVLSGAFIALVGVAFWLWPVI